MTTQDNGSLVERARKQAECIYIAVEKTVADDVSDCLTKCADELLRLSGRVQELERALELPLLFHSGGIWEDNAKRWLEITGTEEATTKVMCDYIRAALAGGDKG